MPALLINTFSAGYLRFRAPAAVSMLAGSAISSSIQSMPGLAAATCSSRALRHPPMKQSMRRAFVRPLGKPPRAVLRDARMRGGYDLPGLAAA